MSHAPGEQLSRYRLVEEIGEGGMGVVWKAEDTQLGRSIALKTLRPDQLGDKERRLRFMREARTAAAVNHPAIASVFEIGEADGQVFIAMELVEGTNLRERLDQGRLPMRDTLRFSLELAEALTAAHEAGIVHRDLKPENVMVRPDRHVKVLDFGLAKLREAADESGTPIEDEATQIATFSEEMTREGRVFGTAAYMSPEQARGLAVDFRSDIFSLGIVLYEMATGVSPFRGNTMTDTLSAIVRDQPREAIELNPELPGEMGRILRKCLEKDADDRYQHTGELAADLRKMRRDTDSQTMVGVSGEQVAVQTKPWRKFGLLGLGAVAVLVLAFLLTRGFRTDGSSDSPISATSQAQGLAVMPFENMKQSDDPERLGQILQELIITDLSSRKDAAIVSSQRLFDVHRQIVGGAAQRMERASFTEVATRAGATSMLTGTLSQLGERWILAGSIVDLQSGKVTRSERIDGDDLYSMVDDLTRRIRSDLSLGTETEDVAIQEQTTASLPAYQRYLEGVDLLSRREYVEAEAKLEEALQLDPTFGKARLRLAVAGWWANDNTSGEFDPNLFLEPLLSGESKASERDREFARAMLPVLERRWEEGELRMLQLAERYPDDKDAWYGLGEARYHKTPRDTEGSIDAFARTLDLDPSFEPGFTHLRDMYQDQRRYGELIDTLRGLVRSDPDHRLWFAELIGALVARGELDEARRLFADALTRFPSDADRIESWNSLGDAYWEVKDPVHAMECRKEVLTLDPANGYAMTNLGRALLTLSRYEESETWLQQASANSKTEARAALYPLTLLYVFSGRAEEAVLVGRELVDQWSDANAYAFLIKAQLAAGQSAEAERTLEAGLNSFARVTSRQSLLSWVAWAYLSSGQAVKAEELTRRGMAMEGGDEISWLLDDLGGQLLAQGKFDEMEVAIHRLLEVSPRDLDAEVDLAKLHLVRGNPEEAEDQLRRILRDGPVTSDLQSGLAIALADQGRFRDAEEQARLAFECKPDVRHHAILAWVLIAGDLNVKKGIELAEKAIALHPSPITDYSLRYNFFFPSAEHAAGLGYLKEGRYEDAVAALQKAAELQPRRALVAQHLAEARNSM